MPTSECGTAEMSEPRDARLTGLLLAALDLGDYEDNVVHVLLKFIHSYTQNVLGEAALLALHAGLSFSA